jgi:uncharacterized protein (TIGR03437 family)
VVSDKSGSANGACTAPPQVSVFTPATSQVWLYFTVSNATVGDTVTVRFLRPDGVAYQTFTGAVHFASGCFTYGMDFAGTTAASYGGPWTIQVLWNQSAAPLVAVTFIVAGAPLSAEPTIQSVGNAASYAGGSIALGEIVYIVGTGMGPAAVTTLTLDDAGLVATQLAGTSVRFNGIPAPLIYTSASAVAAIVPYEAPGSTAQVTVTYQGRTSPALSIPISNALPGLFTLNSSGTGQLSALNEDFSINGAARPAVAGSIVTLFATGEGQTSPTGVDGKPATVPIPKPVASVTATIGGIPAPVLYAGGAPGEVAGVMQVNVLIPPGVSGPAVPVLVKVGTVSSQAGTTIAVAGKP